MEKKITENTTIFDAIQINPNAGEILMNYGMHCLGCPSSRGETVEEACAVHGVECESFLAQLNRFLEAYEADQAEKKS